MATRTATITVDAELATAYNAATKMRQREALSVFRQALRLVPPTHQPLAQLSKKETALYLKINRNLSEEQQARYDTLTEKRLHSTLNPQERGELEQLIREIEQIWVERLQAVGELARLRKVSPEVMLQQLELEPRAEIAFEK
jgi:hypothetical protein